MSNFRFSINSKLHVLFTFVSSSYFICIVVLAQYLIVRHTQKF